MSMLLQMFIFVFLIVLISGFVSKTALRGKRALWLMGGYAVVLVVSMLLFVVIANQHETAGEGLDAQTVAQEGEQLQEAAQSGDLDDTYLHEHWAFAYDEEQLALETPDNDRINLSIYIEEKEENDSSLEIAYYQVPSTVEGQEVANPYPPEVDVEDDTLTIVEPELFEVEYSVFEEPFPFHQFEEDDNIFAGQQGRTLLYLRVPADLDVDTMENVTYVME
ncbi:hypothetical protein HUG20_17435 [Salicibibacter cibi]|uniref:Uncharacterized protein n=1 Tax=Salicibibacter cibi TaxID=2743001 RepID=A0A7T6ZDG7_9BACI|nr:hypothetical protein [Salicibibacter cibi]QQK81518.1 hypothetical protein HUG20_17435 [Salicibibacter cibi]